MKLFLVLMSGAIALMIAIGFGRFGYTPMLPVIMKQTGLGVQLGGLIASVNFLGYTVGALSPIFWKGKGTRIKMLKFGIVGTIISLFGFSLQFSANIQIFSWAFFRFINGVASAWILVNLSSLILEYLDLKGKTKWVGVIYSGVGLGTLLSGLIVMVFNEYFNFSWNFYWQVFSLVCLVLSVPVLLFINEPKAKHVLVDEGEFSFKDINNRRVWLLSAIYFCQGFSYVIVVTFLPLITSHLREWSSSSWLLLAIMAIPSTIVWGMISHKYGNLTALKMAYFLQVLALLSPVVFPNAVGAILCAVLLGLTFMGIVSLVLSYARHISKHSQTMIMALVTGVYSIGQIIGPSYAGYLAGITNSFTIPLLTGAFLLLIAVLLLFVLKKEMKSPI